MSGTDFQGAASRFGAAYEDYVAGWLEERGCTIKERRFRHESGVEFDLFVQLPNGLHVGVECKASPDTATTPGMYRSDNKWKVLGYLYALQLWKQRAVVEPVRYLLITSHMPDPGTPQRHLLDLAELAGDLQIIVVPNPHDEVTP